SPCRPPDGPRRRLARRPRGGDRARRPTGAAGGGPGRRPRRHGPRPPRRAHLGDHHPRPRPPPGPPGLTQEIPMLTLEIGPRVAARTAPGFDDRPYERFALRPLAPTIGAEISGVHLGEAIDDELHAEIHRALLEWKVLF